MGKFRYESEAHIDHYQLPNTFTDVNNGTGSDTISPVKINDLGFINFHERWIENLYADLEVKATESDNLITLGNPRAAEPARGAGSKVTNGIARFARVCIGDLAAADSLTGPSAFPARGATPVARWLDVEEHIQLADVVRHVPGYVYRRALTVTGKLEFRYLSPSINKILGIADHIVIDTEIFAKHLHPDDCNSSISSTEYSARTLTSFREEFRLISSAGDVRWFRGDASARRLANGEVVWDGLAIDITAEKASEAELAFVSLHDSLTGLSNRAWFTACLSRAIEGLNPGEHVIGVFVIDLDAFQEVNESLGQSVGDEVLRAVGSRLREFAEREGGTVARIGGDEFAMLAPTVSTSRSIPDITEALHREITRPIPIEGREVMLEGSMGVATFPQANPRHSTAAEACEELMSQADLALHAVKREEPGNYRLYTPDLDDRFRNRLALRRSLSQAITEQQFELHYQPFVTLSTGAIAGAEALVRWTHPRLGLQLPGHFIPIAEQSGLIVPLGEWIMTEALRQGEAWRRQGVGAPLIAINLSSVQLRRSFNLRKRGFLAQVERALADTGADTCQFEFELTENVLVDSSDEVLSILRTLKSWGFWITIDDFGTGHSTFKYLRDFPVSKIKIDRNFVNRIGVDAADESILRAMINLSRSLGVKVVAEGIETQLQRDFLHDQGCEFGQGYLFSAALMAQDFGWMLTRQTTLPARALPAPIESIEAG
jgi:diguanylate cyclase (GGDEF)-like protein/PAS domain S-box-containing protein